MNEIIWLIYLAGLLENARFILEIINVFGCAFSTAGLFIFINSKCENYTLPLMVKIIGIMLPIISGMSITLWCILPTSSVIYSIVGIKASTEISNTEIGNKTLKLINLKLDEALGNKEDK